MFTDCAVARRMNSDLAFLLSPKYFQVRYGVSNGIRYHSSITHISCFLFSLFLS